MMQKKWLIGVLVVVIPLAIGGLVFAHSQAQSGEQSESNAAFICPITGETLPCSKCCPLNNKQKKSRKTCCSAEGKQVFQSEVPFICPLTGEDLACPKCCPLGKAK